MPDLHDPLEAVVGHQALLNSLFQAMAAGRCHHALCLAGPEGVGRRLIARQLARAFLCPHRTALGACTACRSCRRLLMGSHLDWHPVEASGSSTLGTLAVADLRALEEKLWRAPAEGVGRVVFLPEAHLLREIGQNTLLKALEEPPPSTLFLLIVTRTAELLPTVLSRVQMLRVAPLSAQEMRAVLGRHGSWSEESLGEAITYAQGSPGAALDFLRDGGQGILALADRLLDQAPSTLDPFAWTGALLEAHDSQAMAADLTPAQARRRRVHLFLGVLQRQAGARLRCSFLEQGTHASYDPTRPVGWEEAIEACARAKRRILENLDPALVLQVLVLDLSRRGMGPF